MVNILHFQELAVQELTVLDRTVQEPSGSLTDMDGWMDGWMDVYNLVQFYVLTVAASLLQLTNLDHVIPIPGTQ